MKVMLICPPNVLEDKIEERVGLDTKYMPLDTAYIAAAIEDENQVKLLDALALCLTKNEILKEIEDFNPDIVCLVPFDRCRWGLDSSIELSKHIKNAKVGFVLSYIDDLMMRWMGDNDTIHFSIYGDPELVLKDLCRNFKANPENPYEGVKGVIYRRDGKIVQNPPKELIKDLDELPQPARHLLKIKNYARLPHEAIKTPVVDMLISRGCPYRCSFCLLNVVGGRRRRVRSPQKVLQEMLDVKLRYGAKQVHFGDLIFTMDRQWVMDFSKLLQKEKPGLIWSCQTRVDRVDPKLLTEMKKAGCASILYGLETFDQKCLDLMKKDLKVERIYAGIKETKDAGIEVRSSMMIGCPGETPEIVRNTVKKLIELDVDFAQFHTAVAFPGTELHDNSEGLGKIMVERTMKKYDLSGKLFIPNGYTDANEILAMQKEAYRKFYLRPSYVFKRISKISQFKRNLEGVRIFWNMVFNDINRYIRINKEEQAIPKRAEVEHIKVQ
ncbi:MAG: radical SAM protein [Candidatus Nanoarchaeia archaeon]|nr:radical SAM protein [Candidatus Nanoarchaeia archaeon]